MLAVRRKVLKFYLWFFIICALYGCLLLFNDIRPQCFFVETLGVMCPGCGVTRMIASMARLDLTGAFACNPVVFILLLLWNVIGALLITDKVSFIKTPRFLYSAMWISMTVLILWGIVRNII